MKAIITKYAVTSGVQIRDVKQCEQGEHMAQATDNSDVWSEYFHGNDWHTNQSDATAHVTALFDKKQRSLSKALKALTGRKEQALRIIKDSGLPLYSESISGKLLRSK